MVPLSTPSCPPIEKSFGILGRPLITCDQNQRFCQFHCLRGFLHGASRYLEPWLQIGVDKYVFSVFCQDGKWNGAHDFVTCIDIFG